MYYYACFADHDDNSKGRRLELGEKLEKGRCHDIFHFVFAHRKELRNLTNATVMSLMVSPPDVPVIKPFQNMSIAQLAQLIENSSHIDSNFQSLEPSFPTLDVVVGNTAAQCTANKMIFYGPAKSLLSLFLPFLEDFTVDKMIIDTKMRPFFTHSLKQERRAWQETSAFHQIIARKMTGKLDSPLPLST